MSGFASLLNQFKQTTQQAAASSSSGGGGSDVASRGGAAEARKRPRSIFESNNSSNIDSQTKRKQTNQQQQRQQYRHPSTSVRAIYIACPAFVETGGPEALHQLCHMINTGDYHYDDDSNSEDAPKYDEFGRATTSSSSSSKGVGDAKKKAVKAYMLYLRERPTSSSEQGEVEHIQSSRARSSKYDRYDAPVAEILPGVMEFSDSSSDESKHEYSSELVIWPECWTHLIDSLQPSHDDTIDSDGRKKYQIAIWWLSVNNNKGRFLPNQFAIRRDILHLVQSAYAREYVSSKLSRGSNGGKGGQKKSSGDDDERNVLTLTEFIPYASPTFSPKTTSVTQQKERDLDVVYNPAKGMHYTDEIIRRAYGKKAKANADGSVSGGGIRFSPIGKGAGGRERMTGEEVVALLKRSKVYIDFGPHPGMDRLPREAALAGCVVITNREGAANFDEDVPLPSEFKFQTFDVDVIYTMLKDCCQKHGEYAEKMKPYQEWMPGQEKQMEVCVERLVDKVVLRRIAEKDGK